MILKCKRKWFTDRSTISEFWVDDTLFGYCLEDKIRPEGEKIHGQTAIPYGKYLVKMTMSNRFKKMMPLIYNKTDYSVQDSKGIKWLGVRIHAGNTDKDTDGCLLIGKSFSKDFVGNSRKACNELYELIEKAEKENEIIELVIE